jgi:hypothetical protein
MSNPDRRVVGKTGREECDAVVSVLREAAAWLADRHTPLWQDDERALSETAADVKAGLYRFMLTNLVGGTLSC